MRRQIASLEAESAAPDFWSLPDRARQRLGRLDALRAPLVKLDAVDSGMGELDALLELADLAPEDGELLGEAGGVLASVRDRLQALEMDVLLSGPHDRGDAILAIHAGAGGVDAQDWAQMLLRLYRRWLDNRGFAVEVLDLTEGEEAGIKGSTLAVRGPNAYGLLHAEKGVHRLVRMSPFDAAGRRHTSFASVDVLPDLPADEGVVVRAEDLKIDTFRASGAGGQHINKTESAIRITHLPTGIVVTCQDERSQISNRETAMTILRARLAERQAEERERELAALRGEQGDISFGNQIRSYVFAPYTMVKDHRTDLEVGNVQAVMDGEIDAFIAAHLRKRRVPVGEE